MSRALGPESLDVHIDGDFEGTLRDYFKELVIRVWMEGEGFSGKRPFGNSGWQEDVFIALIEAGLIDGELDEYRCIERCDRLEASMLVSDLLIEHL